MVASPQRVDMTDALLDELEGFEEVGPPPSESQVGAIIRKADETLPFSLALAEKSGPGFVRIYSTLNGEPRDINKTNLEAAMKKVNNDPAYPAKLGTLAFSRTQTMPYVLGTHKCRLHPSRPERALYDDWGLTHCSSEHFPSEYEVTRHMGMDHQEEWKAIQSHEDELRRNAERAEQNEILRTLASRATLSQSGDGGSTEVVRAISDLASALRRQPAAPAPVTTPAMPMARQATMKTRDCDVCGETLTSTSTQYLRQKLHEHKRRTHAA